MLICNASAAGHMVQQAFSEAQCQTKEAATRLAQEVSAPAPPAYAG